MFGELAYEVFAFRVALTFDAETHMRTKVERFATGPWMPSYQWPYD